DELGEEEEKEKPDGPSMEVQYHDNEEAEELVVKVAKGGHAQIHADGKNISEEEDCAEDEDCG
ncbi:MAG: hypothetical protein ACC656_11025, partial [Candidatus Heimdallarchaeota archaeon]